MRPSRHANRRAVARSASVIAASLAVSSSTFADPADPDRPAFAGAEGPGANATGGRDGDVYHVTNLQDDHDGTIPGSLRYGLVNAPSAGRTIVFDVGGTINLVTDVHKSTHTWLRSGAGNITIAGQTAPGTGITIIGQGATLSGNNWVLRNVKFRPGQDQSRPGILTNDGISNKLQNSIIDHVSISWADDEALSSTDAVKNTTVQYSILGEGLNYTLQDGSKHAFGALVSSENDEAKLSYHHNLFVHLTTRDPRLGSENGTGAILNFSNNVIYNWSGRAGYSIDGKPSRTNYLGNYYIAGNNTASGDRVFYSPDGSTIIYQDASNRVDMNKNGSIDGTTFAFSGPQFQGTYTAAASPFDVASGFIQTASAAVPQVLTYAGAMWWDRDTIDARLATNVTAGTGSVINNLTDAPHDPSLTYDSRGFPIYTTVSRPANFDTDQDGMPDTWELSRGLDPNSAADGKGDFDSDQYTNFEEYLNDLAAFKAPTTIQFTGGKNARFEQIQNWTIAQTIPVNTVTYWQPSRFDEGQINSGAVTLTSMGQQIGTLRIASNSGNVGSLVMTGGKFEVFASLLVGSGGTGSVSQSAGTLVAATSVVLGGSGSAVGSYTLSGTGQLVTKQLSKSSASTFNFNGGTLAVDQVGFALTNNGGKFVPGSGLTGTTTGMTLIQGSLSLVAGSLEIELASLSAFDSITAGTTTLGGSLDVVLLGGYVPQLGDKWKIMTTTFISGQFTSVTPGFAVQKQGELLFLVAVPEPATAGLVTLATLCVATRRRRSVA